jgi:hypothetical protein
MSPPTLDLVLFSAGGWRVGLEARWVSACRLVASQHAEDEVIETLLGLDAAALPLLTGTRQSLELKWPGGSREVLVGAPVELVSLPASAIHPLPALIARRTRLRGWRAIAVPEQQGQSGHTDATMILLFDAGVCLATG